MALCMNPNLNEIDVQTRGTLEKFRIATDNHLKVDARLLTALVRRDDRVEILKTHEDGLLDEIYHRMELIGRMGTIEKLKSVYGELCRRTDVYAENVTLKKQVTTLTSSNEELDQELTLCKERVRQLEDQNGKQRRELQRSKTKIGNLESRLAKMKKAQEATDIELCIAKSKSREEKPVEDGGKARTEQHTQQLVQLVTYCYEATKNWFQQTEENNWAAKVIHRLSSTLMETQTKLWDLLAAVEQNFGHVTWLDKMQRRRFYEMVSEKDLPESVILWGQELSRDKVINHNKLNLRFQTRTFTALSSFITNYADTVTEGGLLSPQELKELIEHQRVLEDQAKNLLGVSPLPEGRSLSKLMLMPVQNAMRRLRENRPFHADVFVQNLRRWNFMDALAYQTTGEREVVIHMWLVHLLSSALLAVSGRAVWFTPVTLLYTHKTSDSAPEATYCYYRVGLCLQYHDPKTDSPKTMDAWMDVSLTSLETVLHVVDYLNDYVQESGNMYVVVKAREVYTEGKAIRLKRMKGNDVIKDPKFGEERVLTFPSPEWMQEACLMYTRYPQKDSPCYMKGEDGSSAWISLIKIISPRCDNSIVRYLGLTNLCYNATPIGVTANGVTMQAHVTDAHMKYVQRAYLTETQIVSDTDLVMFSAHFLL